MQRSGSRPREDGESKERDDERLAHAKPLTLAPVPHDRVWGSTRGVDNATYEAGGSYLVVDTGPWILGKKVMLPAGVVSDIDLDTEIVAVNLTKDEIKNAPEFDEERYRDDAYRSEIAGYYGARR
jgi:hypothetical protein